MRTRCDRRGRILLESAVVCDSLDEALEGTVLAIACTARHRDLAHEVVVAAKPVAALWRKLPELK